MGNALNPYRQTRSFGEQWLGQLHSLFGIDLRSLAALRIGLAILLLADLVGRLRDLTAHYTDDGVLPRHVRIGILDQGKAGGQFFWSLHYFSGDAWLQGLLFLAAGVFAFWMLIGYRTRWATCLSWLLLISLHTRNPLVLNGGDKLLSCLLFWSMFLPLGAVASVDAALRRPTEEGPPRRRLLSFGTAALLLQVCMMYWFTAAYKDHPRWNEEFSAIYYAMNLDTCTTWLGRWLLESPTAMRCLTGATYYFEWIAPALVFLPWGTRWLRLCVVFLFWGFHLSLAATMEIGLFPYAALVAWIPFLPSEVWDALGRRAARRIPQRLAIYYDPRHPASARMLPLMQMALGLSQTPLVPVQPNQPAFRSLRATGDWLLVEQGDQSLQGAEALEYLATVSPAWGRAMRLLRWPVVGRTSLWLFRAAYRFFGAMSRRTPFRRPQPSNFQPGWCNNLLAAAMLGYVVLWNVRGMDVGYWEPKILPASLNPVARLTRMEQKWSMFAPYPSTFDGWFICKGRLRNGAEVNLWDHGAPLPVEKPADVSRTFHNMRWRKYCLSLLLRGNRGHRAYLARWLGRRWDERQAAGDPSRSVRTVEIYFQREKTPPPGKPAPPVDMVLLGRWNISARGRAVPVSTDLHGMRTWTDRDGKRLVASFLHVSTGLVYLKLSDGRVATIPLGRLIRSDQQYVRDRELPDTPDQFD